jgi:Spy/CpxP family protein refolding chaperone
MQRRLMAAACVLLTMIPATVSVREGPDTRRRWWRIAGIQRQLHLTPTQVARLDALFEHRLPERVEKHRELEEMEGRLAHITEEAHAGDERIAVLTEQVEALRARQNVRRTLMLFAMYRTLTREQRLLLTHVHRSGHGSPSPARAASGLRNDRDVRTSQRTRGNQARP